MKLVLNIILILTIIATLSICSIRPNMHKSVLVFDSNYKIIPEKQIVLEKETIPIMEKVQEPVQTISKQETISQKQPSNNLQNSTVKKVETKTTTTPKTDKIQTSKKTAANVTHNTENKITEKQYKTQEETKPIVQKIVSEPVQVQNILTDKEEEIAWNVWRSNLQNKIMQDVKLPLVPTGVVFKFSFSVDKFGKISNVQTWSASSTYTPYAIQYIAPVIRSYQGKAILNFPSGTSRTITEVTGGWKISDNEKYSTPQDYNDIERVKR